MPSQQLAKPRSLSESFAALRGKSIGLVPFIPAAYPDLAATTATLEAIDACGPQIAAIEIGFPFSDPIADGPTIQAAFTASLSHKLKVADIFAAVQTVNGRISAPLVGMVSYSIVFRYGPERFFAEAKKAGFGGLIIPDLPPPIAQPTCERIAAAGLSATLLIAPTTPAKRRCEIASLCTGFVYYLSVAGITGARADLPSDLPANLRQIREMTDRPVCVGFGISKPAHLASLAEIADGAIVGSAIVRRMTDHLDKSTPQIATAVADYCKELLAYRN